MIACVRQKAGESENPPVSKKEETAQPRVEKQKSRDLRCRVGGEAADR